MTKKKQSKRATKAAAKKGKRSGVDPTLHEIPAVEAPVSTDAHELSATEPINSGWTAPDIAAQPSSTESIAAAVEANERAEVSSDANGESVESEAEVHSDNGHQTLDVAPEIPVVEAAPASDPIIEASKPESLVESEAKAELENPVAESEKPVPESEKPTESENPVAESEKPTESENPVAESEKPTESENPVAESEKPTESENPVAESEKPTKSENPVAESENPNTEAAEPKTEPVIEESKALSVYAQWKAVASSTELKPVETTAEPISETSSPSIGVEADDIPTPEPIAAAIAQEQESAAPSTPQITSYDIAAMDNPTIPSPTPDIAAVPKPMPNPFGNLESLGKLQRSKSSAEVSKSLQTQAETAPPAPVISPVQAPSQNTVSAKGPDPADADWKAPVDYFGASAAAFSTSFSGSKSKDLNALKSPLDASASAPLATPPAQPSAAQVQQSTPQIQQPAPQPQQPAPQMQQSAPQVQPTAPQMQPPAPQAQPNAPQFTPVSPVQPATTPTAKADPLAALDSALTRTYNSAPAIPTPAPNTPAASGTPAQNSDVGVNSSTGLSPKMAMFVNSLRERGLAPTDEAAAAAATQMQMESTSVEVSPLPSPKQFESTSVDVPPVPSAKQFESTSVDMPKAPSAPTDVQMQSTSVDVVPLNMAQPTITPIRDKQAPKNDAKPTGATARDLAALPKKPADDDGFRPVELDTPATAQRNEIAELRDSIKQDDWRPVQKKTARKADPSFAKSLEREGFKPQDPKPKPQPGDVQRHLTLEEMAALEDPDLILQHTPQQQTIRQLKGKTTAGVRFELYLLVYIVCLGLSWLTEQSAFSGTCRDAGQRIQTAIQVVTPKPLADNFISGVNAFDDKEIKLHPFNPKNPPSAMQIISRKCGAFGAGLASAFGRIPGTIAAASANSVAEALILLAYASVFIISILIYFKFRRTLQYGIADVMLLPICLLAAFSGISAVFTAVLSMSESLAASYIPNTIVVFTTLTIILSALDMARRSFLRRKQNISGRD